ncbi:MAG: 16S rRNA (uracil(1498)-N(3))-methyltransferase [Rhizobiaceae bacterium]
MRAHHRLQRLFVAARLTEGETITLDGAQAHYLARVLRMKPGGELLLFNGADGEWLGAVAGITRKAVAVSVNAPTRRQTTRSDLLLAFAPVRAARLDWMVQRATEMGVGIIQPVMTQHTQAPAPSTERMLANAVEAAEQCGELSVPEIRDARKLDAFLGDLDAGRRLVFCDEGAAREDPVSILRGIGAGPLAILVGPEGGFSDAERARLRALPFVTSLPLGHRILRADTAAVAALTLAQATHGDWIGARD